MADTYRTFAIGSESTSGAGGIANHAATIATLVADGVSPTQAHVTAANTALQALTGGTTSAALLVNVDTTRFPTISALRDGFNTILSAARAAGMAP